MVNTEQEIWKPYPEFPFVEANQFGEIRTKDRVVTDRNGRKLHIKERVLKQQLLPNGYLYVHINVNGKIFNRYVHRIVACSHLPNPDNLPEVNHIDCDRTNNRLDNLEFCTHQENIAYCVKSGRWVNNNPGKPVYAVDLETGKVFRFESQAEAGRQLGVSQGHIGDVLRGEQNQAGGCWFTEDESEITEEKIREVKAKMSFFGDVVVVNTETFEAFYFQSQAEAAHQLGISRGYVNMVVRGRQNKAKDHWVCYADQNAVEKTREKFGNGVAEKVKKLIDKNCN